MRKRVEVYMKDEKCNATLPSSLSMLFMNSPSRSLALHEKARGVSMRLRGSDAGICCILDTRCRCWVNIAVGIAGIANKIWNNVVASSLEGGLG